MLLIFNGLLKIDVKKLFEQTLQEKLSEFRHWWLNEFFSCSEAKIILVNF